MSKVIKTSAGLLMFRRQPDSIEVFLVHPGGPIWAKKDEGAWTIAKGEYNSDEQPLLAAQRKFCEETGFTVNPPFYALGAVRQKSGKVVTAWAFAGNCNPADLTSNTCQIEWPPRSGRHIEIPEVDRGQWFSLDSARNSIREEQVPFLDRLQSLLGEHSGLNSSPEST